MLAWPDLALNSNCTGPPSNKISLHLNSLSLLFSNHLIFWVQTLYLKSSISVQRAWCWHENNLANSLRSWRNCFCAPESVGGQAAKQTLRAWENSKSLPPFSAQLRSSSAKTFLARTIPPAMLAILQMTSQTGSNENNAFFFRGEEIFFLS